MNSVFAISHRLVRKILFLSLCIVVFLYAIIVHFYSGSLFAESDCGLVFGSVVHGVSLPGPGIIRRTASAVDAYNAGKVQYLYMTGGKGREGQLSEAEVMRNVAIRLGVPRSQIVTETIASSTWENLLLSRPLLTAGKCQTVTAFSDRYHLARIAYGAYLQNWQGIYLTPAEPSAWWFEIQMSIREVFGLVFYSIVYAPGRYL